MGLSHGQGGTELPETTDHIRGPPWAQPASQPPPFFRELRATGHTYVVGGFLTLPGGGRLELAGPPVEWEGLRGRGFLKFRDGGGSRPSSELTDWFLLKTSGGGSARNGQK